MPYVAQQAQQRHTEPAAATTLGDVLYGGTSRRIESEAEWERLVRAVAARDPLALHALYERAHRVVYTLALRITRNRETAEELTVDVFHDVWLRAGGYDPANGTVLGWIMNQARSRSLDRLRFEHRRKRRPPEDLALLLEEPVAMQDTVELRQQRDRLERAMSALSPAEREAVEAAFLTGLSHAEVAQRLNQPLGTVKSRIRSALQKLRTALAGEDGR